VWYPYQGLWESREIRHDAADSTHEVAVGHLITNSPDPLEWRATCAHCGVEFELGAGGTQYMMGARNTPTGPFCCSKECLDELDVDLGITCVSCGKAKATRRDHHGNPSCGVLCESRALRARVIESLGLSTDASEQAVRDTIPSPVPEFWAEEDTNPVDDSLETPAADRSIHAA
jgi:hypothetical protein